MPNGWEEGFRDIRKRLKRGVNVKHVSLEWGREDSSDTYYKTN